MNVDRTLVVGWTLVVAAVLLGGCLSSIGPAGTPETTQTDAPDVMTTEGTPATRGTTSTLPPTQAGTPPTAAPTGGCIEWVSFWGQSSDQQWSPDTVRIGYAVTANASGFLVAFIDGRVAGVASYSTDRDTAYTSDGDEIQLRRSFTGTHEVRVLAVSDTNGNGVYDPRTDRPCRAEGESVQADPTVVDFDRFRTESDATGAN